MLNNQAREELLAGIIANTSPAASLPPQTLGGRWPWDLEGLERRSEALANALSWAGADEVSVRSYPWGPEQRCFAWTGDRTPLVDEAELWLLSDDGREVLLCRSTVEPGVCLGALRPTGHGGEVFEVVDVGFGTQPGDYRRHRLAGKLALASGHQSAAAMLEALVVRDAAGLLLGPGGHLGVAPRRLLRPCRYAPQRPFGFNLDAERYHLLLSRAALSQPSRVRVVLKIRSESGQRPAIFARILGAEQRNEGVMLAADLSTGPRSARAAMDAFAALRRAIVAGVLSAPTRTVELALLGGTAAAVSCLADGETSQPRAALQLRLREGETAATVHPLLPAQPAFLPNLVADELAGMEPISVDGRHRSLSCVVKSRPAAGALALDSACAEAALLDVTCAPGGVDEPRVVAACAAALHTAANLTEADLPALIAGLELGGGSRLETKARALRRRCLDALQGEGAELRAHACDQLWRSRQTLQRSVEAEQRRLRGAAQFFGGAGADGLLLAEADASMGRQGERLQRILSSELRGRLGRDESLSIKRRPLSAAERRANKTWLRPSYEGPLPAPLLLRDAADADRAWLVQHGWFLPVDEGRAEGADSWAREWPDDEQPPTLAEVMAAVGESTTLLDLWEQLRDAYPTLELKRLQRALEIVAAVGWLRLEGK